MRSSKRDKTIWMAVLVALLGLIVGYFLGEFFVYISQNVGFLSFLSFLGYSVDFGPESLSLNLMFARLSFGLVMNFSIMGGILALVFLIIYFRRR